MKERNDCIFCDVVKDNKDLIYQDESTAAFLDIFPIEKAHILVIPKKHYDTWMEVSESDISTTNITTQKIAKKLLDVFPNQIKGFNILINNGKAANQKVFHFHIHLIPKFNYHQRFKILPSNNEETNKNLAKIRKLLKKKLNERGN